jgi:hypothetical protein
MIRKLGLLLAVAAVVIVASCVRIRNDEETAIWTPVPLKNTESGLATVQPTATDTEIPPTETPRPVFTPRATATRARSVAATATVTQDPKLVVITEQDVMRSVESSMTGENGAFAQDLRVRFTDGRMRIEAAKLKYGPVNVENLVLVGRLVAEGGKLKLQTESVTPRGLLAALIPTVANQALEQYTSKWYVEDVKTLEGRIEVRIR